jgi:UDP-N-acetylmuramyl pentapeptide phosphotransferase/UDP-N-acetylglucosamine-1-phosphate transferase
MFIWIIWLINAYNFMDGINGIAGVQAITAGVGWTLLGFIFGLETIGFYAIIVIGAALGFLIHNWSPAKVFMGDVGSAFLGFTFAVLPFWADSNNKIELNLFFAGLIFVWFFVFDSVWTFLKRLCKKEKIWQAHRQHIYQLLVISGNSHSKITIIYGIFSITLIMGFFILLLMKILALQTWVLVIALTESLLLLLLLSRNHQIEFEYKLKKH